MQKSSILIELPYLPCIQFFSKIIQGKVYLEQCENYSKGSYRNRCHIAGAQGLQVLSIPLKGGKHQQQSIREVLISHETPWGSQHWTAIKSAYGKSPFFEFYADELYPFFTKKYEYLWEWNWDLLQALIQLLQMDAEIERTEIYQKQVSEGIIDFRNGISPKPHKALPDTSFSPFKYGQVFEDKNGFIPNLSILDLLFCTGPEAVYILGKCVIDNDEG